MKRMLILFLCLPVFCWAQINAITEDGYQIQVFDDGTWNYVDTTLNEKRFIKENEAIFKAPENTNFEVSSKIVDVNIKLNDKDWYITSSPQQEVSEFLFNSKNAEIFGLVISEKAQISLENLRNFAIINARGNVENLQIIDEEYRLVNNIKVLYMSFEGEVEKLSLRYNNYYYSGEDGVLQFITYARKDVALENADRIFGLLNGVTKM